MVSQLSHTFSPPLRSNPILKISIIGPLFAALLIASCTASVRPAEPKTTVAPRATTLKLTVNKDSKAGDEVRCGIKDRAGNLWFGTTADGVFRFDGKYFTHYTVEDGLNSKTIWSILEDTQGRIWFGTDAGLSRWDGKCIQRIPIASALGTSVRTPESTSPSVRKEAAVWSMMEDTKGTIWLGTAEGMLCYKEDVISNFLANDKVQNPSGLQLKMVDDILEDRQGNIWFASGMPPGMEGLCKFDGTSLTSFKPGGESWIRSVRQDSKGILWMGTRNKGVWRYDGTTFSRVSEHPELGMPLLVDKSGNIWFGGKDEENGSESGIWRYDGTSFQNFSDKDEMGSFGVQFGTGIRSVWCMVEDRDGNIWIGTRNTGLYRFDGKSFIRLSE